MRTTHRLLCFSFAVLVTQAVAKLIVPLALFFTCTFRNPEFRYAIFEVNTVNAVGILGFMTDRWGIDLKSKYYNATRFFLPKARLKLKRKERRMDIDCVVGTSECLVSLCPKFRYAVFGVGTVNAFGILWTR